MLPSPLKSARQPSVEVILKACGPSAVVGALNSETRIEYVAPALIGKSIWLWTPPKSSLQASSPKAEGQGAQPSNAVSVESCVARPIVDTRAKPVTGACQQNQIGWVVDTHETADVVVMSGPTK